MNCGNKRITETYCGEMRKKHEKHRLLHKTTNNKLWYIKARKYTYLDMNWTTHETENFGYETWTASKTAKKLTDLDWNKTATRQQKDQGTFGTGQVNRVGDNEVKQNMTQKEQVAKIKQEVKA